MSEVGWPGTLQAKYLDCIQSGASSLAKHGGAYFSAVYASSPAKHGDAYFSAVYESIQDLIAAPGPYENQEP